MSMCASNCVFVLVFLFCSQNHCLIISHPDKCMNSECTEEVVAQAAQTRDI